MEYILEVDETYKIDGQRSFFTFTDRNEAIARYHSHWRGMVNLRQKDETGRQSLAVDEDGRKYIKGSPFYNFPHVPHKSKIDGKEIPST